ncbi:MAG: CreA family protein [Betaproteobacteria bacterium]|nr:CreA family protein [Betaproteobacteria bacterium]
MPVKRVLLLLLFPLALPAAAENVGCVTTAWKMIGPNHKVCVEAFTDPKIPGLVCHISQAKTGGISGALRMAEDPTQFSLSCNQIGAIDMPEDLPQQETVFSESTSLVFKETRVERLWDKANLTLIYLAISRKLIDGAPVNAISAVPVWRGR